MSEHRLRARMIFMLVISFLLSGAVGLIAISCMSTWKAILFTLLVLAHVMLAAELGELRERRRRLLLEVASYWGPRDYDEMMKFKDPDSGNFHI